MSRALVCFWILALIALVGVEFALAADAPAKTGTPPGADISAFDAKLESLQDAKVCITNAKTKADVQACQKTMHIDSRKKIEVHGY